MLPLVRSAQKSGAPSGDPRALLSPRYPGAVTRRGDGQSVLPDDNAQRERPGNQDQTKDQRPQISPDPARRPQTLELL